jgi:hypothetical protein
MITEQTNSTTSVKKPAIDMLESIDGSIGMLLELSRRNTFVGLGL